MENLELMELILREEQEEKLFFETLEEFEKFIEKE